MTLRERIEKQLTKGFVHDFVTNEIIDFLDEKFVEKEEYPTWY